MLVESRLPGGLACGSFGLTRGSVFNHLITANGHSGLLTDISSSHQAFAKAGCHSSTEIWGS
jgi:hypothetical protein